MTDNTTVPVDPSNTAQLRAWDGPDGDYWTERAERFNEGVAAYHAHFLAAAAIGEGERVLDIGCGSGQTTRDAARLATAGSALGVDLSSRMIALARGLAEREGVANVEFHQADAQVHPFVEAGFDLAVSRSGAMFFGDPAAAFANIARAVRPGGRLLLLAWQPLARNGWVAAFRAALAAGRDLPPPPAEGPSPFSLSDPDRVRSLLTAAGFADVESRGVEEPMYFGRDPEDATRFIAGQFASMLADLDAATEARALDALRGTMAAHHTDRGVLFDSAAWLIHARRASR